MAPILNEICGVMDCKSVDSILHPCSVGFRPKKVCNCTIGVLF